MEPVVVLSEILNVQIIEDGMDCSQDVNMK